MRHVLITAGSKGLGKMMTDYFLKKGCSVTATYRSDKSRADQLVEMYKDKQDRLQVLQLDVTDQEQIDKVVEQAVSRFGRIDCFVSNAGPYIFERKKLVDYEEDEWNQMVNGNLNVSFHFLKKIIPLMRKQQFGRVIFLGFQGVNNAAGWILPVSIRCRKGRNRFVDENHCLGGSGIWDHSEYGCSRQYYG